MVVTDRFIYIHMPKTGGTFVEAALTHLATETGATHIDTATPQGRSIIGGRDQHQVVAQIPDRFRGLPILFTTRNPYDHMVSFYTFGWWKDHAGDTFDETQIRTRYPHYPELDFGEFLRAHHDWALLDKSYISASLASRLRAAGVGPLAWEYLRFLSSDPVQLLDALVSRPSSHVDRAQFGNIHFVPMENLNRGLHAFLLSAGYSSAEVRFILGMEKVYPTEDRRRPDGVWRQWYTPELAGLVRNHEWRLFGLFPEYDDTL
ncbi:MAG TPA: hypothetical protein VMQ83_13160 [Gammaproteobacteria bacterium]|nr:hypothetical protein [Gammaproteobacteria bacterium]